MMRTNDWSVLRREMELNSEAPLISSLIDTVKCEIQIAHDPGQFALFPRKGGAWKIPSVFDGHVSAQIYSRNEGKSLFVEGSAVKFLTGQNVYGAEQMLPLAQQFLRAVLNRAGVQLSSRDEEMVALGRFRLLRADLAVHAGIPSIARAEAAMRLLYSRLHDVGKNVSRIGWFNSLYLNPLNRDWWVFTIYRKDFELAKRALAFNACFASELRKLQLGLIRFEAQFGRLYLRHHGLDDPSKWTSNRIRDLLAKHIWPLLPLGTSDGALGPLETEQLRHSVRQSLRSDLLKGLAFGSHWSEWTDRGEEMMSFLRRTWPGSSQLPSAVDWVD